MTKFKVGELVRYKQCITEYKIVIHRGSDAIQHCTTKAIYTKVNWHSLECVPIPKSQTPYKFKVGDRVECVNAGHCDIINGETYVVLRLESNHDGDGFNLEEKDSRNFYLTKRFKLATNKPTTTKEESTMSIIINETILEIFPNGKDAALVTKFVGKEYPENNHRALLDLKLNAKAILKHCKDEQTKEDEFMKP